MIDYKKCDVIYTVEWPFNHWKLNLSKYISEMEAKEYFENKEYFQVIYLSNDKRIFCIGFEINFIVLTVYEDEEPMYEYVFRLPENSYCKLVLASIREKNITCALHDDGNAYIVERSSLMGKDKKYKKKYDYVSCRSSRIKFNQYEDLLKFIDDISIKKLLV